MMICRGSKAVTFVLVFFADHEPGDILEEDERDTPLAAQLDKMGTFQA